MFACELQTIYHGLAAPKKQKVLPKAKKTDKVPQAKASPITQDIEAGGVDGAADASEDHSVSIAWPTNPHLHSPCLNVQFLRRAVFFPSQWDMDSRGMN